MSSHAERVGRHARQYKDDDNMGPQLPTSTPSTKKSKESSTKQDAIDHYNELITTFLTGIVLPILLGVFTIPSLMLAAAANDQSQIANQISLMSLCAAVNETNGVCADILAQADDLLPEIANAAFAIPSPSGKILLLPSTWGQAVTSPVTYVLYAVCGFTLLITVVLLVVRGRRLRSTLLQQKRRRKAEKAAMNIEEAELTGEKGKQRDMQELRDPEDSWRSARDALRQAKRSR
ncbi:hypothetical protein GQ53DRAFT_839953 [Thozetella sp. PMI_491]|nr:hypothetical protein GQ53DRAFT_839953 [Thozetella sp. PMI_491]